LGEKIASLNYKKKIIRVEEEDECGSKAKDENKKGKKN